jgi:peroxiredoxin
MLQRGDSVPAFEVRTLEGEPFTYSTICQHKNLLLVSLPAIDSEAASAYAADVTARVREFGDQDIECVVTQDQVPRISPPAVVVADRWGEIVFAVKKSEVADLPAPQELIEWLTCVSNQCPECEGEAR